MSLVIPTELPEESEFTPCSYAIDVTEGDPQEREYVFFSERSLTVALWQVEPYAEHIDGYLGDEFAYVVKGELTLTDPDGTTRTFRAGDTYVMQQGWSGEFRTTKPFLKYFALSVPSAEGAAQ